MFRRTLDKFFEELLLVSREDIFFQKFSDNHIFVRFIMQSCSIYLIIYLAPMKLEEIYQKKTPLQHVLLRPDTYIGSATPAPLHTWVLHEGNIQPKHVYVASGLYKIFDEILVNANDNRQRDKSTNCIRVSLSPTRIQIWNNGPGIPVQIHKEHKVYIPELVFGHLLTSSCYDDSQKKVTGGRNGYGAKLANIFSLQFEVETVDKKGKRFYMRWNENMTKHTAPQITAVPKGQSFTRVVFSPDFKRFQIDCISPDLMELLERRVHDIAGTLGSKVKVFLNEKHIKQNTFELYAAMYLEKEKVMIDPSRNTRWQVGLAPSRDEEFHHISFVNGIHTRRGGHHVNHVSQQIVKILSDEIVRKNKELKVTPSVVKSHIFLFLNCLIENPAFDSQLKEELVTTQARFGSSYQLSEQFTMMLKKSSIVKDIVETLKKKIENKVNRKLKGKKVDRLIGIPKLEDANLAGRQQGCTLIVTEGDSAKSLAMAGIEVLGRDRYGVFPLKGKIMNVRQSNLQVLGANQEIKNLVKIMGLQMGKCYADRKTLRYSHLMIMTDQDVDGTHIRALIINMFHHLWPSLLHMPDFLSFFITPLIKVRSKDNDSGIGFYTSQDFKAWVQRHGLHGKTVKYYKGLGTSTSREGKEYFSKINEHRVEVHYGAQTDEALQLAFSKKRVDERKVWLSTWDPSSQINYPVKSITVSEIVHKELIHFSNYDNIRSIPSVMDGLKPGHRKILFAAFKRNLNKQLKVAQLTGYVAQHAAYHHGEFSLAATIIGMAHDYVGSNNLPLFQPIGQFGTRSMGGKDASSPRYLFTKLNPLARTLFVESDDHVVNYQNEEGMWIEPEFYLPVIPFVLVNGAEGIGTGWSTLIPHFNPSDIVEHLLCKLTGADSQPLLPWWRGWRGQIERQSHQQFLLKGKVEQIDDDQVQITELPVNKWPRDFKTFIQEKMEGPDADIVDLREYHEGNKLCFVITFGEGKLANIPCLQKYFKLNSSMRLSNMVAFNAKHQLHRYSTDQIINQFIEERLKFYERRKDYELSKAQRNIQMTEAKLNFIKAVKVGQIRPFQYTKEELEHLLFKRGFKMHSQFTPLKSTKPGSSHQQEDDFAYLFSINVLAMTRNKLQSLEQEYFSHIKLFNQIESRTCRQMWIDDLQAFQAAWDSYLNQCKVDKKQQPSKNDRHAKKYTPVKNVKMVQPIASKAKENKRSVMNEVKSKRKRVQEKIEIKKEQKKVVNERETMGEQLLLKYTDYMPQLQESDFMKRVAMRLQQQESNKKESKESN